MRCDNPQFVLMFSSEKEWLAAQSEDYTQGDQMEVCYDDINRHGFSDVVVESFNQSEILCEQGNAYFKHGKLKLALHLQEEARHSKFLAALRGRRAVAMGNAMTLHRLTHALLAIRRHGGDKAMLKLLRNVALHCDFVHDLAGELIVEATRLHDSGAAWQYSFRVLHAGALLAQGRATVSALPAS